jgi:chitodextrinase
MSVNETADIYYTLDGSAPTTSSTKYTSPLSVSATTTIKAFAKDTAGNSSAVQTVTYTLDATPPADTTAPNNVTNLAYSNLAQTTLTLSWTASTSSDVASYDVFNGSTLLANVTGTTYNVSGLTASTQYTFTVKAKDAANNVASGTSVTVTTSAPADTTAPTVTASPAAGTYTSAQSVTLTANETATIYYTTNGTTPTTASTVYTGPISISATTTLQFIGKDTAGNTSTPVAATYTINIPVTTNYLKINYASTPVESVRTPSMTFNKVVIDATPYYSSGWAYLIDAKDDANTINGLLRVTNSSGAFDKSANVASVLVNGVSATTVSVGQRQTIEINFTTAITNVATIGSYQNVQYGYMKDIMKADIYNIKFYNGATLLAHYDMTKGNVQDQSGNGNHAAIKNAPAINNNTVTTVSGSWG